MRRLFIFISIMSALESYAEALKIEKQSVSSYRNVEITEEEIRNLGDLDFGSILTKRSLNVNIARKGVYVSEVFLNGFGRENINFLIDGARVYGACPNNMDTPSFFVRKHRVKGVEIVQGTKDIQNQGSLGGYINVITREPLEKLTFFELGSTAGSFNQNSFYFSVNLNGFLFDFNSEYGKPYDTGEGKKVTEYLTGTFAYQDRFIDKKAFDLKESSLKIKKDNLSLSFSYLQANSILYPYLLMDSVDDENVRLNLRYIYKPDNIKFNLYYFDMKHDMRDSYRKSAIEWTDGTKSKRGYMMRTYAKSKVYGIKTVKNGKNFTVGVEVYKRFWNADNTIMFIDNSGMIPDVENFNFGVFTGFNSDFKNFNFKAGVRFDHMYSKANQYKMKDNRNLYSLYYSKEKLNTEFNYISGFLGISKRFNKNLSSSLLIGQSVRFPNPQELFLALKRPTTKPNWVGNPFLKPVKNREIRFNLNWKITLAKLSGSLFYSDLKDYIYPAKIGGTKPAMSYMNIDAFMYGLNLNSFVLINENIYLSIGMSYQRGKKKRGEDRDLAEIPPLKVIASFNYENENFLLTIEDIYNSQQKNVDSSLNETSTESWNVLNLRLSYKHNFYNFTIGIDNLFDKFYYQHLSYLRNPFFSGTRVPEPGRSIYLGLDLKF